MGDRSSPEDIRRVFGLSKKAFKRAVGYLMKQRSAHIDEQGFVVAGRPTARPPAASRPPAR